VSWSHVLLLAGTLGLPVLGGVLATVVPGLFVPRGTALDQWGRLLTEALDAASSPDPVRRGWGEDMVGLVARTRQAGMYRQSARAWVRRAAADAIARAEALDSAGQPPELEVDALPPPPPPPPIW